jgi:DNA-binding transcriptional LysR family regulator
MSYLGTPTLDQLKAFLVVVEEGSFAAAARRMSRATSVVSYTISNLEGQLGVELFDRESTRRPRLTEAGRAVLVNARTVSRSIDALRAKVRDLQQGVEAEVRLVIDAMLPAERVVDALHAFRSQFPAVSLHLRVEARGTASQLMLDGEASVAVTGPSDAAVEGTERIDLGSVTMVPVAAPGHPLALAGQNPPGAGRAHVQLVITDRSQRMAAKDLDVPGEQIWRLDDLASKHLLLKEGMGWGNMPEPVVRDDIETGRLVALDLPDCRSGPYRFFATYRADSPPGPAASYLIARFASQAAH